MLMTKKQACDILNVSEGASKEEIKQEYAKIALTIHPDQKTSTPGTTELFKRVSLAYKRLQQPANCDWVQQSHLMEQFSTVFRFRMKTENGYVYFMYNPFTGLPDSDSDDFYDEDDERLAHKSKLFRKQIKPKKIVDVDPVKFREMKANADKNAAELINEEDKEKIKARKRKEKKLRQKEKKKQVKEEGEDDSNDNILIDNMKAQKATFSSSKCMDSAMKKVAQQNKSKESINRPTKSKTKPEKKVSVKKSFVSTNGYESDDSDSDEPGWDANSAFVTKAFKHVKPDDVSKTIRKKSEKNLNNESSSTENNAPTSEKNKPRDVIALSRQLAVQANQLASNGNYNEAAKLFTQAISLFATDCRYYGNRSYCYDRMGKYNEALDDANTAISLSSFWAKGYFRKGRALAGLGRYMEAEHAYEEVLKLDRQCFDAEQELHSVRLKHLIDMGFSKQHCEIALKRKKTIGLALDELLNSGLASVKLENVYVSDPEEVEQYFESPNKKIDVTSSPPSTSSNDDAFSEVDYNSLWIGNITSRVTQEALYRYFSQFGTITGLTPMYERRCAFVNFSQNDDCKNALLASDTVSLCGETLVIRYPDRAYNQATSRLNYKSKRECFYWRNKGCHYGSACRYLHVEANKGIDLQTVERTPYKSITKY